eukprot:7891171-Pyramimonas_sp.AAC.1
MVPLSASNALPLPYCSATSRCAMALAILALAELQRCLRAPHARTRSTRRPPPPRRPPAQTMPLLPPHP